MNPPTDPTPSPDRPDGVPPVASPPAADADGPPLTPPDSPLAAAVADHVAAAFPGLWVRTHEQADAAEEVGRLCRARGWALAAWDVDRGLRVAADPPPPATALVAAADPVGALRALASLAAPGGSALLLLPNFHRFLGSAEVVQALAHQLHRGRTDRTFVVLLAPAVQLPPELEKLFVVLDHELPGRAQLAAIAAGVATEPGELPPPGPAGLDRVLDAAAGLTRHEAEGAFALSLVRHGEVRAEAVWALKAQALGKSGLLALHRGGERFADLGGLGPLKAFCAAALGGGGGGGGGDGGGDNAGTGGTAGRRPRHPLARPRGVLLLGVPGTGKSAFAKALGNEAGRPTVALDVGALMGSLVGQTEANVRRALALVDAMAPCVCFLDEVEKALAGAAAGGGAAADGGVSARLFGALLTWLSDRRSDVFVVCTSNDASRLPAEFARAERFDGVFFLDLPGPDERAAIWPLHRARYGIPGDDPRPDDRDWTGAEVAACCRLAALLGVPLRAAAAHVVPVAVTAAEQVERLRAWAAGRCLSASAPAGVYARGGPPAGGGGGGVNGTAVAAAGRRVARPSRN